MNACSIKGTSYEKEYKRFLSDAVMIFVWNANNEQPLDKKKVGNEVIDNPLFQALLNHPVTNGNRETALRLVAQSFLPIFTNEYTPNEQGDYTLEQVVDYVEKKQRKVQEQREQIKASINLPTNMSITINQGEVDGQKKVFYFSSEQGQEIYDTLQYLLGIGKSWTAVYTELVNQRDILVARVQEKKHFDGDIQKLVHLTQIIDNYDFIKSWYDSKDGLVGEEVLETKLEDSEDWKSKEKSQKERASSMLLGMVMSLPQYRYAIPGEIDFETGEEYQEVTSIQNKGTVLGLPKAGDFQKNWNLLGQNLAGLTSYSDMYKAITVLSERYPQFKFLLAKIPNPTVQGSVGNIKQFLITSEFKRVFSTPEVFSVVLDVSKKQNGAIATTQQVKGFQPIKNAVGLYDSQYFSYNQRYKMTGVEGNEVNIDAIVKDYAALFMNLGAALGQKVPLVNFLTPSRTWEFIYFMQALGLGLNNQAYLQSDNKKATFDFILANLASLKTIYEKLKNVSIINEYLPEGEKITTSTPLAFVRDTIQSTLAEGKTLKPVILSAINKAIEDNKIKYKAKEKKVIEYLGIKRTELQPFITFFSQYDTEFRPSSYLNAAEKQKFVRGPWFFLTQMTNEINNATDYETLINTPGLEKFDYRRNPDILGSVWLSKMFGLPTNKKAIEANPLSSYTRKKDSLGNPVEINILDFGGTEIKNLGAKSGKVTTDQHPGDKIFQDFASFFQSTVVENIRFGDKSSAFASTLSSPMLADKIYVPMSGSQLTSPVEQTEAEKELTDIFIGYLGSEVNRLALLLDNPNTDNNYGKVGKNLFIFADILPKNIVDRFINATTKQELVETYTEATSMMSTVLQNYFSEQAEQLVDELVDIFSLPINITTGVELTKSQRLKLTAEQMSKLNIINSQLLPAEMRKDIPAITPENLPYLAQLYLKNGFIHNVEFLKFFIGDIANFQFKGDFREVFKRIPFASSPGNVAFWDSVVEEFFETDTNQDALSKAYSGVENKFSPVVRTTIYNDVLSFSKDQYDVYKQVYDSGNWDSLTESENSEFIAYTDGAKEADGQGVITLDFYRNYLLSLGGNRWSEAQEEAYNKQVRFAQINQELKTNPANAAELIKEKNEIKETTGLGLFPPLKLGHFGPIVEDPKLVGLHKFSLVPLIPTSIEGKQLEKQLDIMYKNKINYYTFKSGSKMSNYGKSANFYKEQVGEDGVSTLVPNDDLGEENVTTLHLSNLREQQYQAPKFKSASTLSTQMMKLVFGDFFEDGLISEDYSDSTKEKIGGLYEQFKKNINDLVKLEQIKLERKLGITRTDGVITAVDELQLARFLAKEFEDREAPEELRKFIQIGEDNKLKYPLDAIADRSQIETLILNVINNKIISQKVSGESYIQVAGTGFETVRFARPTKEQLLQYGANDLQFYRPDPITGETLPMEVKVGFNVKKHAGLLALSYKEGTVGTIAQLNKILKSNAAVDIAWRKKHMDKLTMVGVRIPVQGAQSMEYAMIKEFLPESAGAIMVLPAQIVTKSGGDYDIDKLTFFETSYDFRGEVINQPFNVEEYSEKVANQKDLKLLKAELKALAKFADQEISSNSVFLEREVIKFDIGELKAQIKEDLEAIDDLLDNGLITAEERDVMAKADAYSEDLQRLYADLQKFDADNDIRILSTVSKLREEFRRINSKMNEVRDYKRSLTNNLTATLKAVMQMPEFYDSLITPNTNSVLTQYTYPSKLITSTDIFNPLTSWRIYKENILSKDALGIDAKINTMQKEFQIAGLRYSSTLLNTYYFPANKTQKGNIFLGGKKDALGENRISKVLSEFINGHVDIAKEDWIILLGLDQETSPLAHAMILAGTPIKNVLDFINSPTIKNILKVSNRPEIDSKLTQNKTNKRAATLALIKAKVKQVTNKEVKEKFEDIQKAIGYAASQDKKLSDSKIASMYVEMLTLDSVNTYIKNFNPSETLEKEEADMRELAYLLQFYVVVKQQESLRKITSLSDFNTTNYRTSFQSVELTKGREDLYRDFNVSAVDYMFEESALAQFNVSGVVSEIMSKVFPLSESDEVLNQINDFLDRRGTFKEEERIQTVKTFKNNLLLPYIMITASNQNGNLLEYYRGKNGLFNRTTPNNIEQRFIDILQNPDLRNNFLINNLYVESEDAGFEIEFKLKNTEIRDFNTDYRKAFLEGLNHSNPEVKQFFVDLALGSYLQHGGHFTKDALANVVPHEAYIEYTKDALEKISAMDSHNFQAYMALVRFSTKMTLEGSGPLKLLASFLENNYPETRKTFTKLTPGVVSLLSTYEKNILAYSKGESISSIKTDTPVSSNQKAEAQNKFQGQMTFSYGANKRSDVTSDTTFDAILKGERTATTRYESDKNLDYWKNAKVGDVITWKSADNRTVDVVVTKALHPLVGSGKTAETWSKLEGWSVDYFNKNVKSKIKEAWQIEFKLATTPQVAETQVETQQNFNLKAGSKVQINTSDTSFEVELKTFRQRDDVVELSYVNRYGVQVGYRGIVRDGILYPREIFNQRKGWSSKSTATYISIELSPQVAETSITEIKPQEITFRSNKLETFERQEGLDSVQGYGLVINNQPNVDLFTYKDGKNWIIIDNLSKKMLPLRDSFSGGTPNKRLIQEELSNTLNYYIGKEQGKKVLEGIGFNFGPSTTKDSTNPTQSDIDNLPEVDPC